MCESVCLCVLYTDEAIGTSQNHASRTEDKHNFLRICQVCLTVTYHAFILVSVTLQMQFEMICGNFKMTPYQCSTMGQPYYDAAGGKT